MRLRMMAGRRRFLSPENNSMVYLIPGHRCELLFLCKIDVMGKMG